MTEFLNQSLGQSFEGDPEAVSPESAHALTRHRRRQKPSMRVAALNITSFMDLTFNLLLFFVLTASFSASEGVLPADLPVGSGASVSANTGSPPKTPLFVTLHSFGAADKVFIQVEGTPTSFGNFDELYDTLAAWRHDKVRNPGGIYEPDNPIVIKPDRSVPWDQVVEAFNTVVRAKYRNVGFEPPE